MPSVHGLKLAAFARVAAFLLPCVLAVPAIAAPTKADIAALVDASKIDVQTFTLKNGMQVVVIPDHRMPVVTHMVWYRVGSADEVQGKSGLAHFLEHLMFKGTKTIKPGEYSKIIARNGGQDNASTSWDYTDYFQRVARDRLPLTMQMDADRMENLRLTDDIVLPERDVIVEERRQRIDNQPESLLVEQIGAALYENSHYGIPVIGWIHEMQKLTTQDALDWYHRYYAPNNAILVVAGDITADDLKPLAEKTYGRLRRADTPPRSRPEEPKQSAARRVTVTDPRAEQPEFIRTYHAPNESDAVDAAALDVASQILGGSATSRLHKALVIEHPIAASASAGYWSTRVEQGEFSFQIVPRAGVSIATAETALDAEIARFVKDGPTADELAEAQFNLIAESAYDRDSQESLADNIATRLTTGETLDHIMGWPSRIAAVTPDQVKTAVSKVLDIQNSVTGILLPQEPQQ
jgi:zinc protease